MISYQVGLPKAVQAHSKGNYQEAYHHYQRALDQGVTKSSLYQNFGALLRKLGKVDEAEDIYRKGLQHHPNHIDIINNYSNLIRDTKPLTALKGYLVVFKSRFLAEDTEHEVLHASLLNIIETLRLIGSNTLALRVVVRSLLLVGVTPELLRAILLLQDSDVTSSLGNLTNSNFPSEGILVSTLKQCISDCEPLKKASIYYALSSHYLSQSQPSDAIQYYEIGTRILESTNFSDEEKKDAQEMINIHAWNFSCLLLKLQNFSSGWKMFEYGLQAPAEGPQRWQRALTKPFTSSQLPLWRGESLRGKKLLVLEEQGIGDGMMFLTLLPRLIDEALSLTVVITKRLYAIYTRSFESYIKAGSLKIITMVDLRELRYSFSDFDFQTPIGSICQYRYLDISSYSPAVPVLKPNLKLSVSLKQSYSNILRPSNKIIGISWRGGGRADRIRTKSPDPKDFISILRGLEGFTFVSLQYGPVAEDIKQFKSLGVDVHHDESIDPIKDMESWLNQVAACDAVLSVATTTVHGSGGLDIPTMCLLSWRSDWRWFEESDVKRSYWYPSVGIARASKTQRWVPALSAARHWLKSGAHYPEGPQFTNIV